MKMALSANLVWCPVQYQKPLCMPRVAPQSTKMRKNDVQVVPCASVQRNSDSEIIVAGVVTVLGMGALLGLAAMATR